MERLIAGCMLMVVLGSTGCGVMIGTPDYWEKYNNTLLNIRHERISEADRAELDRLVDDRGKRS